MLENLASRTAAAAEAEPPVPVSARRFETQPIRFLPDPPAVAPRPDDDAAPARN